MPAPVDTIAAIVTPPGTGGVAIVRVSGPKVPAVAKSLLGQVPTPRMVHVGAFFGAKGEAVDHGLALYFEAPKSFTGEHVLELQGHGGQAVSEAVLHSVLSAGARHAEAGEFTKRAYLNNKIDLAQAEAVADLIHAQTKQAARSALNSLQGQFSQQVQQVNQQLIALRVDVEAALDFPEEEIDFIKQCDVAKRLQLLQETSQQLLSSARSGLVMQRGLQLALVGQPNAGKSSLFNVLCGDAEAIVTAVPGTTRDVLKQTIQINGIPLNLHDTAGIRQTDDPVEAEGVRRAQHACAHADVVLWVIDLTQNTWPTENEMLQSGVNLDQVILVGNKIDRCQQAPQPPVCKLPHVLCSAKLQSGLEDLKAIIVQHVGCAESDAEDAFTARARHVDALVSAQQHLMDAGASLSQTPECCAEHLRCCQLALESVTGRYSSDDLLGEIFSSFCIGK